MNHINRNPYQLPVLPNAWPQALPVLELAFPDKQRKSRLHRQLCFNRKPFSCCQRVRSGNKTRAPPKLPPHNLFWTFLPRITRRTSTFTNHRATQHTKGIIRWGKSNLNSRTLSVCCQYAHSDNAHFSSMDSDSYLIHSYMSKPQQRYWVITWRIAADYFSSFGIRRI